jgi:hypothetical protein
MNYFYNEEMKTFSFQPEILDKIKNLKSVIKESGYYDYMVTWSVDNDRENAETIWRTMQFLSMTSGFTDELIEKYSLTTDKKYHVNLLRTLYTDNDDDENDIIMGFKRPFGNSHVLGDVREELELLGIVKPLSDDEYDTYDYSLEEEVLKEFSEFIVDFYKGGFKPNWYSFETVKKDRRVRRYDNTYWYDLGIERAHSYLENWIFGKSEYREIQLNKIFDGSL